MTNFSNAPFHSTATAHQINAELGQLPQWDLSHLYAGPDDQKLAQDIEKAKKIALKFTESWTGKLAQAAIDDKLYDAIEAYENLGDLLGRIGSYAMLYYVGDTNDAERSKFFGDTQQALSDISTGLLFFELELNRIDDTVMDKALRNSDLAHYAPWINDLRKERPFQLEDKVEQLFHEKGVTGAGAWNRLFDETMAALTFNVKGEDLALEPTLNLLVSPDPATRENGAHALAKVFGDNIALFARITNTLAKDKEISDNWRGFKDVAASRHLANRVEDKVVDALEAAVTKAYPRLSHRYYAMKAKWLGVEKLKHWDRNAPLPDEDTNLIAWDDARKIVLEAYGEFEPEMAKIAERFFTDNWIDAAVRPGKTSGAFAHPTVPSAHPYVLLNYQGKTRDVMTLAHELGHGVHQVLAAQQGPLMASTPLTLAETASVFGEMLTFRSILNNVSEPKQRKALLASKVEDMLNTVVRQIAFYTFERRIHTARRSGELTAEQIGKIWMDVQRESLGEAIEFEAGYETFWAYIPHFIHSPFYVYAYAFGDCLVNSLYARYQQAEEGFQKQYFDMLKAGGSKHHSQLLKPFGLDATDPKFWDMGLSMIEGLIDEIAALDAELG